MNKTLLTTFAVAFGILAPVLSSAEGVPTAQDYLSFLGASDRRTLLSQNELTGFADTLAALPGGRQAPFFGQIGSTVKVAHPTLAVEGFFLFSRPAGLSDLKLYNAVQAVSTMEGLQYYSVTRKQWETLILGSWRVSPSNHEQKLSDPVFSSIPSYQSAVIFQKDNKTGDGHSELTWRAGEKGSILITFSNLDRLTWGILPLVEPGNMQMAFEVVPLQDKILVYGVLVGETAKLFGLEKSKNESFRNRMRALASWLGARVATIQ